MKKKQHTSVASRIIWILVYTLCAISIFFIILLLIPRPSYKQGFTTLDSVNNYAKATNENTPFVGDNTIKPDFNPYYKSLEYTWKKGLKEKLVWLGSFIKITRPPDWSASFFKKQLEELTKTRQEKKLKDNFVCKITPTPQSKIVVFGNIQGAFHSLVRCLNKLKEINIIDQNLKITNPEYFIVFLGDIVSRSAFTMDTLSLVMRLLQANPDTVIYLRGNHESNNYWQEHTLKTELQSRAAHLDKNTIPLADAINAFFNTLPMCAYIAMATEKGASVIRIADPGRTQNKLLNEQGYADFLHQKSERISYFPISEGMAPSSQEVEIPVVFKGEKKRETYQPSQGFRLLPPDMGSVAWNILSCPTVVYQKALKFFHDAVVVINPATKPDDWTLTVYNRDVRTQDPFKVTTYNLLSAVEVGTGAPAPKADPEPKEKEKDKSKEKDEKKEKPEKIKEPEKPQAKPEPKPEKPVEAKPEKSEPKEKPEKSAGVLDNTITSTVAAHVREIGKDARALAEHAEAIASIISKIQLPDAGTTNKKTTKKSEPTESKPSGEEAEASAFEPIS